MTEKIRLERQEGIPAQCLVSEQRKENYKEEGMAGISREKNQDEENKNQHAIISVFSEWLNLNCII